jgi:hypothetical protein
MTNNIYLDKEKKVIFMNDFKKLLDFEMPFWKLDDGVKNILMNINANEYIYTLYSKRLNLNQPNEDLSYIKFCYYQDIELHLFRTVVPDLILTYNIRPESMLYYDFLYPRANENCTIGSSNLGLMCTDDKDYFFINHLAIYLKSPDLEIHDKFWNDIEDKLSNLNPN